MIRKLFLNDKFILVLILINAMILFAGGFITNGVEKFVLTLIDNMITGFFLVELIVKFNEFSLKGYFKSNWNKLDFILIVLSIPALVAFIFNAEIVNISFLLVFRILRVFKSFRFFKFIPEIGHLIKGIQRALKASVFVFLGFVIYIFIIGIFSFYLFNESAPKYFNDPIVSLYSIFKIFTIEGWFEIPEQITKNYSQISSFFTYFYFIFLVLSGGIFGISLINSIFVDSMVSDNNDELEKKIDNLDKKITELLTKSNYDETRKDIRQD